jgi:FkbM family methyltransferase
MGARSLAARGLQGVARAIARVARALDASAVRSKRIERGVPRSLYRTRGGQLFWLDPSNYLDRCIAERGVFEPDAVAVMRRLVQHGDVVLDVGANIGFHTVLLSELVGPTGRVHAFEPTAAFRAVLERNVVTNLLTNVEIHALGLSDRSQRLTIQIGDSSATLHPPGGVASRGSEQIELVSLDEIRDRLCLDRLDFVKVDVDGHEPAMLRGAARVLAQHAPLVLLEVNHLNYLQAGWTAWDFFRDLTKQGYRVYDERGLEEIEDETEFLIRCGNFHESRNVLIARAPLPPDGAGDGP